MEARTPGTVQVAWARGVGFAAAAIALAVLAGWLRGWEALVRWLPGGSHMVTNAALCSLVAGAGFLAISWQARRTAAACGALVAVFAGLVLVHRMTGWPGGIDQLLWTHQWGTADLPRGQMAPNACFAFVLVGLSLVILSSRWQHHWLPAVMSGVIIASAVLPLVSFGLTQVLPGGASMYRGMAAPTMVCMLAFGAGILGCVNALAGEGARSLHLMAQAFGMLIAVGILSVEVSADLADAERLVLHSYQARGAIDHFVSEVARMESSARAYAFTGVSLFRDRAFFHQGEMLAKLDEVRVLLADNPVQAARVVRLRELAVEKFALSDRLMDVRAREGEAAAARFLTGLPTEKTSALVVLADQVQGEENRLLTERERTRALVERNTHASQALGGALALALLGMAATTALRATAARAAAEADLRRSERMFQRLFEGSPDAVVLVGGDGRIVRANGRAGGLFGWPDGSLAGERLDVLLPERVRGRHGGHLAAFLGDPKARPMGTGLELFCRRRDGSEIPVDVMLSPVEAGEGAQVVAVVRDISERKRAEADRLVLSKLESTGILAEGIAHDFNNLLTVILLNIDLAESSPDGALIGPSLEGARKATMAARGLTKQLITFADGGDPVSRPTAVEGLLRDAVALALSGSDVATRFDIAPGLRAAQVDEGQVAQVIRNLALNAREAMPAGGTVTVAARRAATGEKRPAGLAPGDYLHISVADEGVGIPDDIRARIFDPYFTTKQRGNRKGMGLGLTICYSIARRHGGDLTVESAVGRGTTFHLFLPASPGLPPGG